MEPRWPYREARRGQLEAAKSLAEAVREGRVFALSAPTGFGKTATIIYGLLLAGVEKAVYVVRTRNELVPVIRELSRFGVEDYVFLYSARRMCPLLSGEGLSTEDFWETCRLLRLRGECSYHRGLERVDPDFVAAVVRRASSPFEAVRLLAGSGVCPFFALKLLVGGSRFIVATYPYVFRRDIFLSALEPLDYSDFVLVVDEAHSLLNAQSLAEARLPVHDIDAAIAEVEEYGLPGGLAEALEELKRLVLRAAPASDGLRRLGMERVAELLGDPDVWSDAAYEVRVAKLREALESGGSPRIRVALTRVEEAARAARSEGYQAYAAREGRRVSLTLLPLDPCVVAEEPLNASRAAVLASGTLPPEKYLREALCIRKQLVFYDVEILHGPVMPPGTRYVIVAAELTSRYTARSPSMYRLYAEYIATTHRAARGVTLAVYPSYDFMSSVVAALTPLLGEDRLVVEDRSTSYDEVAEAVLRGDVVVNAVAGGKLSEGVEFLDESGRSLVTKVFIAGVPYPQPDDYLEDQLAALSRRLGREEARRYMYDVTASVKVRQAVGRAQRGPGDRAVIVLGDARFLRRSLRSLIRLPVHETVYTIGEHVEALRRAAEKLGLAAPRAGGRAFSGP